MSINSREKLYFDGFYVELYRRIKEYLCKMRKNPEWFLMSLAGRFNFIRSNATKLAKQANIQKYQAKSSDSIFPNINVSDAVRTLKEDGLYSGIVLPDHILQEILDFAYSIKCYGNLDSQLSFLYSEKEQVSHNTTLFMAQYFNTSLECSAINALAHDPTILEIAAMYLGTEPIFTKSRLWWNFAVDDRQPYDFNKTITFFHYDLYDYASLTFFFYLTDVDSNSGPHVYVRGSHINKNLFHIIWPFRRRSNEKIVSYYGSENIICVTGEKGFGFAEDTFCYHKATRPLKQDRLMLQIQFAMKNYGLNNDLKDP